MAGKSVSQYHRHSAWQRTERRRVYGDTGMTEMDWATGEMEEDGVTGSIYSGDPGVDRSQIIFSYNESHTLSFPSFHPTHSFRDIVDPSNCVAPHGRVVSYLLTLFLCSSSQNRSFSRISLQCRERCGGVLMMPSSSAIPPQREAFGRWQTLSLWKLWLIEGSTFVEALANRRL